jgi:hypothetical protein
VRKAKDRLLASRSWSELYESGSDRYAIRLLSSAVRACAGWQYSVTCPASTSKATTAMQRSHEAVPADDELMLQQRSQKHNKK